MAAACYDGGEGDAVTVVTMTAACYDDGDRAVRWCGQHSGIVCCDGGEGMLRGVLQRRRWSSELGVPVRRRRLAASASAERHAIFVACSGVREGMTRGEGQCAGLMRAMEGDDRARRGAGSIWRLTLMRSDGAGGD